MVDVIPTTSTMPDSSITFSYLEAFPGTVDLTENGENDTLFLDFRSLTGETPPPFIHLYVGQADEVLTYEFFYFPVVPSAEPFTVAIPFNSFTRRGGGPEVATFEEVFELIIALRANEGAFGAPEELGWTAVLDRIRVGAIPEPSAGVMIGGGILVLWTRLARLV
jgi:hypothetical protein